MSNLPSLLAFLGPEEGQRNEELDILRARITKESGSPADEHRIYLPDGSVAEAVDLLQNGSLFATHRLVIVFGAEQIRLKADLESLAAYLRSNSAEATLVLVSDGVKLDPKLEKLLPSEGRRIFWELFENQKRGWVVAHVRKAGVSITPEALDLFLELVENNTRELRIEADKLCAYVGSGGRIDVDEVETFIYHSREESVFSLFRYLVQDDFQSSLEVLETLTASGEGSPAQLVAGLVFQVRKLLALRSMLDNGLSFDEACRRLAIRGKRIQADYRTAAERFTVPDLERAVVLLADYDTACRTAGHALHGVLLNLLVYQLLFPASGLSIEARSRVSA